MNKLAIPSILAAIILIAGMFALMPIEKASTVHTTIQNALPGGASDFALFTTEDTGPSADNFVTCTSNKPFTIYVSMSDFGEDPAGRTVQAIFADGDLVQYKIPALGSFSFSQSAGGTAGVDDSIKIDPQDQDGDANAIAGWVSISTSAAATFSCTTTTFNPIP